MLKPRLVLIHDVFTHRETDLIIREATSHVRKLLLSALFPFAAFSQCGVAGLSDTFPPFPVSGAFLRDVPGFHIPYASVFPSQVRSSSRALPLHLHFHNCSYVFCFIASHCHNHSNLLRLMTISIGSTFASSKIHVSSFSPVFQLAHLHCPSHHSHLSCR